MSRSLHPPEEYPPAPTVPQPHRPTAPEPRSPKTPEPYSPSALDPQSQSGHFGQHKNLEIRSSDDGECENIAL